MTARLLTIADLAERLRVSKRSAYRIASEIPPAPGKRLLFEERDVDRYVATRMRGGPRDLGSSEQRRHPLVWMLGEDFIDASLAIPGCCRRPGYTYIVESAGLAKIGCTEHPRERGMELQVGAPVPLKLVALFRGLDFEGQLHEHFAAVRAHGEWFEATPVLAFVEQLGSPTGYPCLRCIWDVRPR